MQDQKGTGAESVYVPKDEQMGKMTSLDGQRGFERTKGNKDSISPLESEAGKTCLRMLLGHVGKKNRETKAQLELNLVMSVKDNKKYFTDTLTIKGSQGQPPFFVGCKAEFSD